MKLFTIACAAALAASFAVPAVAATPGLSATGGSTFDGDGPWTLGWSFSTTGTITITGLGAYDAGGDGFTSSHAVGLWSADQTLLASTTVTSASTLIDGFRYGSITSLTLTPGTYFVGAADFGTGDAYLLDASISTISGISFLNSQFVSAAGLAFPGQTVDRSGSYFGGNVLTGAVPEPATWALMIGGFGLVGATARRRRRVLAA